MVGHYRLVISMDKASRRQVKAEKKISCVSANPTDPNPVDPAVFIAFLKDSFLPTLEIFR